MMEEYTTDSVQVEHNGTLYIGDRYLHIWEEMDGQDADGRRGQIIHAHEILRVEYQVSDEVTGKRTNVAAASVPAEVVGKIESADL